MADQICHDDCDCVMNYPVVSKITEAPPLTLQEVNDYIEQKLCFNETVSKKGNVRFCSYCQDNRMYDYESLKPDTL